MEQTAFTICSIRQGKMTTISELCAGGQAGSKEGGVSVALFSGVTVLLLSRRRRIICHLVGLLFLLLLLLLALADAVGAALEDSLGLALGEVGHVVVLRRYSDQPNKKKTTNRMG